MSAAQAAAPSGTPQGGQSIYDWRVLTGLLGVLLAAMMSGLSNRVVGLGMADISGALGIDHDMASWLDSAYAAGELAAMPFATWFAITFSLRRFHLSMQVLVVALALIIPEVSNYYALLVMRGLQGLFAGAMIPLLMMSALRFLPAPIRLHGLALYAMTATLAPNVAVWIAAYCLDTLHDWRWLYWQLVIIGAISIPLVAWGIPKMPPAYERIKQGNWLGMAIGFPGLVIIALTISQAVRLDWFNSSLVQAGFVAGGGLFLLFLASEWFHPTPFIKLQLLGRRNLGLGFAVFFCLLLGMAAGVGLPMNLLGGLQGFRVEQMTGLGLIIGLPQIVLGSVVAILLYQRWVDARYLFAGGLFLIAMGCLVNSHLTSEWMVDQFFIGQVLQTLGQPMAVVPLLFLGTSVVQPFEGPFVSGIINTMRAFGSLFSGAMVGELMHSRQTFHSEILRGQTSYWLSQPDTGGGVAELGHIVNQQALVLAGGDIYEIYGVLMLLLIPPVLCLKYIPAPQVKPE